MGLKPRVVASCCALALSLAACRDVERLINPRAKEDEPWKRNVLAAQIRLPEAGPSPAAELSQRIERAGSMSGVKAAAAVDVLPGASPSLQTPYTIQHEGDPTGPLTASFLRAISPGYFRVMGLHLLEGRDFSAADGEGGVPVAIVDRSYAKRVWPQGSPLGRRMRLHDADPWATVVGVVQDGPGAQGTPELYIPLAQSAAHGRDLQSRPWFVLALAAGEPKDVAPVLSRALGQDFEDLGTWLEKQ